METFPKIITVKDQEQGLNYARNILYRKSDNQTLLFLSGGSTPKVLYQTLAQEKRLRGKAVGMIDEREDRSNFEMIKNTGLLTYFKNTKISFYPIISSSIYNKKIRNLIKSPGNKIAIMGIGEDGHTAGLPAKSPSFAGTSKDKQGYVEVFSGFSGKLKERISMTFKALSEMDLLIILAFGSAKQNALGLMFRKGSEEEIPSRFYLRPDIASKTILITDQEI